MLYQFEPENVPLESITDSYEYLVFGRETCPETSRIHLQGFVAFKICTKFSMVQKRLPNCHLEIMCGTVEEIANYCKKDGDFQEFGVLPTGHKAGDSFKRVFSLAEDGNLERVKQEYHRYYLHYRSTQIIA